MNIKKFIVTTLSTALVFTLAACGQNTDAKGDNTSNSDGDTLTVTMFDKNSGSYTFDDRIAQEIMKRTGVKIEIENPTGDPTEKLNLMLTGQNYPDIVLMDRGNDIVNRYIEAGALVNLTELISEYGPNVEKMYGEVLNKTRYKDGNNYYLSNWYGDNIEPVAGVSMRYDYLVEIVGEERANSGEPFTQSEYVEICEKFLELHPTMDGKPSVAITWNGETGNYLGTLKGMYGMKSYYETNEGLKYWVQDPKFMEMIGFANDLYTKNLLDKEWVVNKTAQFNQKLSSGNVFSTFTAYWDVMTPNDSLEQTVSKDAQFYSYKIVADGVNPEETTYSGRSILGWDAIAITNNCKNPEAAMKLIDFLVSEEGQYLMMWGIEGEDWTMEEGKHVPNPELIENFATDIENTKLTTGIRKWTWFVKNGNGIDGTPYDLATKYKLGVEEEVARKSFGESDAWDTSEFDGLAPSGNTPQALKYQKIQDIYEQAFPKLVNASSKAELNKIYETLLSDMKSNGLTEIEEVINKNYNDRMELWGLK